MTRLDRLRIRATAALLMLRAARMQRQTGLPFGVCLETQLAIRQIRVSTELRVCAEIAYQHHLEQAEADVERILAARAADRN